MAWKRSSVQSRPGPPNKHCIFSNLLQIAKFLLPANCAPDSDSAYRESDSGASFHSPPLHTSTICRIENCYQNRYQGFLPGCFLQYSSPRQSLLRNGSEEVKLDRGADLC